MGTRAQYIIIETEKEEDNRINVGDEFLESCIERLVYDKCHAEILGTTTTHWDGYPSNRIPQLWTYITKSEEDSSWHDNLMEEFGEDTESGCDYVYVYDITKKEIYILYMDFPELKSGKIFGYICVWSGKMKDIVEEIKDENAFDAKERSVVEQYSKYKDGKIYRYNMSLYKFVEI